jgi:hypothetical protein
VRDTPVPIKVTDVTVVGDNTLTGSASFEERGKAIIIKVKVERGKIMCIGDDGEKKVTLTATKKAIEGKTTETIEGTYEAEGIEEGKDPIPLELNIKRTNLANK